MNPQNDNPFQSNPVAPPSDSSLPPIDANDPNRNAAADVIRGQIDQLLSEEEDSSFESNPTAQTSTQYNQNQVNQFAAANNQPMIAQNPAAPQNQFQNQAQFQNPSAATGSEPAAQSAANTQTSASYNTNPTLPTIDATEQPANQNVYDQTHTPTSDTEGLHSDDQIAARAAEIASKQAEQSAVNEAHQKYHTAWQGYYQKYYERYYMDALQQQRAQFAAQNATVATDADDKTPAAADGTLTQKEAIDELRSDILGKVKQAGQKVRKSRHFIPAIAAIIVILIAVFIQYNGLIFAQVASFISPGDTTDQNIIIGTGTNQPVGAEPRLIIPKINVDAPVIYGLTDLSENSSQRALQDGPIHYPIAGASAFPGQNGNTVVMGHSSADWFEPGNFKFIFVQLNRLSAGDLFYLDYNSVRYTYRVTRSEVINPNQIGALAIGEDKPYATLITCDPPGTALRRLVVFAEQISPDPNSVQSTQSDDQVTVEGNIAGNPPTLFERVFGGK